MLWRIFKLNIEQCNLHNLCNSHKKNLYFRHSCGIPDPDNEEFIITGGDTRTTVSVYKESGWDRDLASLKQGRFRHACARYLDGDTAVKNSSFICTYFAKLAYHLADPDSDWRTWRVNSV